jgi:tRNA (guanine-N7-)-methyltransferase
MRLKHVKNADIIVNNSKYIIKNPSELKGKFKDLFANNNPIYIEIGMGKGNFIIENAKKYPNINYIGIEKYDSVMIRAVQKLEELELNNLKLIRLDAKEIENIFDKEISRIYLNFSDPWPKDRHAKRRLTSPEFLKRYENIFKNNEEIIMKTDNRKLFEYSIMMFNENNFKIENISLNLYEDNYLDNIPTEYEIKFHEKGFPIYRVHVTKK